MTAEIRMRAYVQGVTILGGLILAFELATHHFTAGLEFSAYLGAVILSSLIKIRLPGLTTTLSPNVIPILLGIAQLTSAEAALLGLAGAWTQSVWHTKSRFSWLQFGFRGAVGVIAAGSTGALLGAIRSWKGAGGAVAFATLAVVFFITGNLPVCTAIALRERKRLPVVWRECFASSFPIFMFSAIMTGVYHTAIVSKLFLALIMPPILLGVYRAYWMLLRRFQQEKDGVAESAALNLRTMEALVGAIAAKDGGNSGDFRLVQAYALETGKQLQLPEEEMKALAAAALLRDIGKMAIPDHLLARPGKLAGDEIERMRSHVEAGAAILQEVNFPYPVVPILSAHHERWDGTGYPNRLQGVEIPLGARIIGAVDALVSLSSYRPYRPAVSVEEAMAKVVSEAGLAFDPTVVAALEQCYRNVPREESHDARVHFIVRAKHEDQILASSDTVLTMKESLAVFAMRLRRVVPYETLAIHLQAGERLMPEYVSGEESKRLAAADVPLGDGISGKVCATSKSILNADPAGEFAALGHETHVSNLGSAVAVPLESVFGGRGVLTLYRSGKNAFLPDELKVLLSIRLKVLNCELHPSATAALLAKSAPATAAA